jgi:hypothetical protein
MDNVAKRKRESLEIQPNIDVAEVVAWRRSNKPAITSKNALEIQEMMTKLEQDMPEVIRYVKKYAFGHLWEREHADVVQRWISDCHVLADRIRAIDRAAIDQRAIRMLIAARDMATACRQQVIANEWYTHMNEYKTALTHIIEELNSLLSELRVED